MALGTACDIAAGELLSVYVLVAVFALRRSGLEVDVGQSGLKIWRLVAVDASGRSVRAQQRKLCFGVIEAGEFLP